MNYFDGYTDALRGMVEQHFSCEYMEGYRDGLIDRCEPVGIRLREAR